ncbi:MAG: PaaI family thioesterase [Proteobacteria bacterium]|nr:PaaI family thioesterase [Pseudomonadota bacterium]
MQIDFQNVRQLMINGIPHMAAVGLELVSIDENGMVGMVPHRPEFVGDPDTGVVHGGIVTVLLDSLSGMCIVPTLNEVMVVATLDLRIDYLKPAAPRQDIFARAHCYKTTRNIAFTRGIAYQRDIDDPIAHATGSFMLTRPERTDAVGATST